MVRETVLRARAASAKGKPVYAAFLDLKKAFDSVPRNILWSKLAEICSGKFYRCVKNLFTGLKARVKIQGHLSREIPIDSGVCQGSSLGPVLFLIFINDLLNDLEKNKALGVRIGSNDIPAFGFADLTLLAPTCYLSDVTCGHEII